MKEVHSEKKWNPQLLLPWQLSPEARHPSSPLCPASQGSTTFSECLVNEERKARSMTQ